jgi:Flp pilus assembly protein TadG
MRRIADFIGDSRGDLLVEFAISVTVAVPVMLWVMELCFCLYCNSVLQSAARHGVQYAITHGSTSPSAGSGPGTADPAGDNVKTQVTQVMLASSLKGQHALASMQVNPCWGPSGGCGAGSADPGVPVSVQVRWPYQPYIQLPWIPATIQSTATGVIQY